MAVEDTLRSRVGREQTPAMPCLVVSEARLVLARDDGSSTASMEGLWTCSWSGRVGHRSLV